MLVQGETQRSNSFCAVASSVMVLNSLEVSAPDDEVHGFPYFNQDNFFSSSVEEIITAERVQKNGFTLAQLGEALSTWEYGCQFLFTPSLEVTF